MRFMQRSTDLRLSLKKLYAIIRPLNWRYIQRFLYSKKVRYGANPGT